MRPDEELKQFEKKAKRDDRKAKVKGQFDAVFKKVKEEFRVLEREEASKKFGLIATSGIFYAFEIPFSWDLSKNRMFGTTRRGGFYIRSDARKTKEALLDAAGLVKGFQEKTKTYLSFHVEKPVEHMGDAINFLDSIADCVKKITGIDDRWYSVRSIDWSVNAINPKIWVLIDQPVTRTGVSIQSLLDGLLPRKKST